MFEQNRWTPEAAIPVVTGVAWLWHAASFGAVGFLFSLVPGCLLLASGVSILLWPGDTRIPAFAALGGLLGVPFALPIFLVSGSFLALLLIGLSAASYLAAGAVAVRWEPHVEDVPAPERSLSLAAQVAADEVVLATMHASLPMLPGEGWLRVRDEVALARTLFAAEGWLEKPESYHELPPPLVGPHLRRRTSRGVAYEHMRFESDYQPREAEPGRERFQGYTPNRTAHAWVLRHEGPPRPWMVLIHGFQLGHTLMDFSLFDPGYYHEKLGLNLVYPVLPFHGHRKVGRRSGDGFLTGDVLDTIHAEAQAMWDVRRILSWVREQGAPDIGVHGISLGGYQTSLLVGLEPDLACAIAGIPVTDIPRVLWRHGPQLLIRYGEYHGMDRDEVSELMRVVSPLTLQPRVPKERLAIYGGVADRLVTPDHVRDLWEHWQQPRIEWYQGAHVSFRMHPAVNQLVNESLAAAGLVPQRA